MAHTTEHGREYERLKEALAKARKSGDSERIAKAETEFTEFMAPFDKLRAQGRTGPPATIEVLEGRVADLEAQVAEGQRSRQVLPAER